MSSIRRAIRPLPLTLALLLTGQAPTVSQIGPVDCGRELQECFSKSLARSVCHREWFRCMTRQY